MRKSAETTVAVIGLRQADGSVTSTPFAGSKEDANDALRDQLAN
jgi:hypothetical protein